MSSHSVSFYSDGIRLSGTVMLPEGYKAGEKRPAVLICHGRFAIKEWVPSRWTPSLLAAGYVCMTFDYRNLGESDGNPGTIIPDEEVRDVHHAVTFLQQQAEVDAGQIAVLGWGLGGGVVVNAAAKDLRIKAVVCASSVADGEGYGKIGMTEQAWAAHQEEIRTDNIRRVLEGSSKKLPRTQVLMRSDTHTATAGAHQGWIDSLISVVGAERAADPIKLGIPNEITLQSMEALYAFRPFQNAHLISPRPLLVVHSSEDDEFPFEHARKLFDLAGAPKKLIEVKGAGHLDWIDPTHPTQRVYVPAVVRWIEEHIPVPTFIERESLHE